MNNTLTTINSFTIFSYKNVIKSNFTSLLNISVQISADSANPLNPIKASDSSFVEYDSFYSSSQASLSSEFNPLWNETLNYTTENETTITTYEEEYYPFYMQVTYCSLYLFILPVGVLGNLLVPLVVCQDRELSRTSTGAYLVNLAVADLLVLIICLPPNLVELMSPIYVWVFSASMCKYIIFYLNKLTISSVN